MKELVLVYSKRSFISLSVINLKAQMKKEIDAVVSEANTYAFPSLHRYHLSF